MVGVPQSSPVPDFLSDYKSDSYTDVGTLQEPDLEALARLDPDLVVVGFRSAAAYPDLSKTYPTVDITFPYTNFLDSFGHSAEILGQIFGKEAEVDAEAGRDRRPGRGDPARAARPPAPAWCCRPPAAR